MALIDEDGFEKPFVLDIIQLDSKTSNQYDLPFHYFGQIMSASFKYESPKMLEAFGKANGYQHLWKEGHGTAGGDNVKISWLNNGSFYTLTSATHLNDEIFFVRLGANDPSFNLRRDPAIILRKKNAQKATFVSVLETHGSYSPVTESSKNSYSIVESVKVIYEDANYIAVEIKSKSGATTLFVMATEDSRKTQKHELRMAGKTYNWVGPFYKSTINSEKK